MEAARFMASFFQHANIDAGTGVFADRFRAFLTAEQQRRRRAYAAWRAWQSVNDPDSDDDSDDYHHTDAVDVLETVMQASAPGHGRRA